MSRMLTGCAHCDFGWRWVTDEYRDELFPIPEPPSETMTEAQLKTWETAVAAAYERRETFPGAVFPCPECRPEAFRRWAAGCWNPAHVASECELCTEALGGKAAASHDRAANRVGAR